MYNYAGLLLLHVILQETFPTKNNLILQFAS